MCNLSEKQGIAEEILWKITSDTVSHSRQWTGHSAGRKRRCVYEENKVQMEMFSVAVGSRAAWRQRIVSGGDIRREEIKANVKQEESNDQSR